jgi:uncharacterized protein YeaO (DUF488 family)
MRIYTSYFGKLNTIPTGAITPIAICGKSPEWYKGLEYKILAPKYKFFQEWKQNQDNDFYIEHFDNEVLAPLSAAAVYEDLEKLSNGNDCVLLCYEKTGDFCHRHLVAKWLETNLNIKVVEWGIFK